MNTPTTKEMATFQQAFDHFNKRLFGGTLKHCLITLPHGKKFRGYHWADRFQAREGDTKINEIAMNPDTFEGRTDKEIISTLVHEQVHLWQHQHGKPSRGGYHNAEWADKMESVGLMPSTTAEPGGKRTGPQCSHYILAQGKFDVAYAELDKKGFKLNWQSYMEEGAKRGAAPKVSKQKFSCPGCDMNVWGAPTVNVKCGDCDEEMVAA